GARTRARPDSPLVQRARQGATRRAICRQERRACGRSPSDDRRIGCAAPQGGRLGDQTLERRSALLMSRTALSLRARFFVHIIFSSSIPFPIPLPRSPLYARPIL